MRLKSFVGPSYASWSPTASVDELVNLFVEVVESGTGANAAVLYGTPGLQLFSELEGAPGYGIIEVASRVFAAAGTGLWEIFAGGQKLLRGNINASAPVSMATNGFQLLITTGTIAYIFDLATNTFTKVPNFPGANVVTEMDGYFIAPNINSRQFNISALNDGTSWDPLDFATKEGN